MDEIDECCWYSSDFTHLKECYKKAIVQTKIDERCKIIEAHAFDGCNNLTKVELPENITEIGESAFANCISLREITGTEQLEKIGSSAFYLCDSLTKFTISQKIDIIEP
ncbi:MAG: leucine-rich repeat domain-containing protein, partial [Bacteroidales bacterium]|nr:leucine-rich repeat domain-containing protein [Bacteroidales bacterium]